MTGLGFFGQMTGPVSGDQGLITTLSLLAIAAFVIWLVFFSGNGDFKSFLEDLKGQPKSTKVDPFPVPVFDKSKIQLPRPAKPVRKPVKYQRTADEIDLKLDTWARDLRQSLREVRAESQWLVEKYKDVPLKRPKPESTKKPKSKAVAKPKSSKASKPKTASKAKTTKKAVAKPKPKAKSAKPKASKGKK